MTTPYSKLRCAIPGSVSPRCAAEDLRSLCPGGWVDDKAVWGNRVGARDRQTACRINGGDIGLTSTPGRGSTFWFTVCLEKQRMSEGMGERVSGWIRARTLTYSSVRGPLAHSQSHGRKGRMRVSSWPKTIRRIRRYSVACWSSAANQSTWSVRVEGLLMRWNGSDTTSFLWTVKCRRWMDSLLPQKFADGELDEQMVNESRSSPYQGTRSAAIKMPALLAAWTASSRSRQA